MTPNNTISLGKFNLGQTVITAAAQETIKELSEKLFGSPTKELWAMRQPAILISKHSNLEQGELDDNDYQQNLDALKRDDEGHLSSRIFSAYKLEGIKFWVITEWDESVTTILLPSDY